MSGPPEHRHQIEFAGEVVEFFVAPFRGSEEIPMRMHGRTRIIWRPLTSRGTDYGQWTEIWRLGLPTLAMGGVEYAGHILRFGRIRLPSPQQGTHVLYEIEIADAGSAEHQAWRDAAKQNGYLGQTGGQGREYGWWS